MQQKVAIVSMLILVVLLLTGCGYLSIVPSENSVKDKKDAMTRDVLESMTGEPATQEDMAKINDCIAQCKKQMGTNAMQEIIVEDICRASCVQAWQAQGIKGVDATMVRGFT